VFVRDPVKHRDVLLHAGEEPAPEYAALVTNPACWENGEVPTLADTSDSGSTTEAADEAKTDGKAASAAKKTAAPRKSAASKPARGRDAADEGNGGD
jgi:hypothetical protein